MDPGSQELLWGARMGCPPSLHRRLSSLTPRSCLAGLGRRVPPPGCHEHALLDRDPPARAAAVAGQGADPDGLPAQPHLLGVLTAAPTRGPAEQTPLQASAAGGRARVSVPGTTQTARRLHHRCSGAR